MLIFIITSEFRTNFKNFVDAESIKCEKHCLSQNSETEYSSEELFGSIQRHFSMLAFVFATSIQDVVREQTLPVSL